MLEYHREYHRIKKRKVRIGCDESKIVQIFDGIYKIMKLGSSLSRSPAMGILSSLSVLRVSSIFLFLSVFLARSRLPAYSGSLTPVSTMPHDSLRGSEMRVEF